ncbi:MAG TPA: DUF2924 domain-containing protein [Allosphingosinicella sp.]|jgi:hypothetical protein
MMAITLEEELAALATMSPAQLRDKWQRVYRGAPPPFAPDLLARGIAYRLQERVYGKLPTATRREIERLQRQFERTGEVLTEACATTKPGTVLVREWKQEQHHVLILDEGYRYRDRRYGSLSEIANEITGARWSGPRFFGLRQGQNGARKAPELADG